MRSSGTSGRVLGLLPSEQILESLGHDPIDIRGIRVGHLGHHPEACRVPFARESVDGLSLSAHLGAPLPGQERDGLHPRVLQHGDSQLDVRFVQDEVRYVGVEVGISRRKPEPIQATASRVLRLRIYRPLVWGVVPT